MTMTNEMMDRCVEPLPSREEIERRLCVVMVEVSGMPRSQIHPSLRILEDLSFDSLGLVELLMEIEDEFAIEMPRDRAIYWRPQMTLGDVASVVELQWGTGRPTKRTGQFRRVSLTAESRSPQFGEEIVIENAAINQSDLYTPLGTNRSGYRFFRRGTDGMRCVLIPGDEVLIGSDEGDADGNQRPVHAVELSPFLIDAEPVSCAAYARFLNVVSRHMDDSVVRDWFVLDPNDRRRRFEPLRRGWGGWKARRTSRWHPMMLLSWYGANAYALWANGRDWRKYRCDSRDAAAHLPTEAQWEYAARGCEPRKFPWGDDEASAHNRACVACIDRESVRNQSTIPAADVSAPLGTSPFGLHHMAGNVWQWCRDWYDADFYTSREARQRDAINLDASSQMRSERGGSWVGPAMLARSSFRRGRPPTCRGRCLGFRCVGSAKGL